MAARPDDCFPSAMDAERVQSVRRALPTKQTVHELAQVFALLADPGRLRLTAALLHAEEMCVRDLAAATGQSTSATSHALRLLRLHHVVQVRRTGRLAHYRLADSHMRMLFDLAITHIGHVTDPRRGERNDG
ncbi:ArsR/SmtB family transcription factor [Streptosporangium lutulentum]|uniref:DNA-binding transcriptional ArsR family regulator n=1 Tax=Streptosporangium lutulentum TaxID=1461250 RepID=A0ABT9Q8K0_9ACTN|nr:metalloregulator ArsR/SmtB family transcription factor [Streptosporangium lutulentum]MDP9843072.1 DNA-binding transcriptional ArsR family regulator [Streptosporangium lutulentum]